MEEERQPWYRKMYRKMDRIFSRGQQWQWIAGGVSVLALVIALVVGVCKLASGKKPAIGEKNSQKIADEENAEIGDIHAVPSYGAAA